MPPTWELYEKSLAYIRLCPLHAVAKHCLFARRQQFAALLWGKAKLIGQLLHDCADAHLPLSGGHKNREHQRLIIWNGHSVPIMHRKKHGRGPINVAASSVNLKDVKPGPIRRAQLAPELVLRIDTVRAAVAEVCSLTQAEWHDAFQRDADPEHEMLWWERVAGCYVPLVAGRAFSRDQRQAAFNVIFGLFSGVEPEQLESDLAKLPESAMDDLAVIVRRLGTVN